MLRNIRLDHFRPDESRTSRLIDALKLQAGGASTETQNVIPQAAESVEVPTTTDEAQVSEAGEESEPGASSILLLPLVRAKMRVMTASMIWSVVIGSLDGCGVTSEVRLFTRHLSLQL